MPEASSRRIGLLLGGLLLCVLVVMLAVTLAVRPLSKTSAAPPSPAAKPAGPRLQSAPQPDLGSYRARKQAELAAIGPIEGEPGWARIPLDRAMDLMSEQGLRATGPQERTQ